MRQAGVRYYSFTNITHDPDEIRLSTMDLNFLFGCIEGSKAVVTIGNVAHDFFVALGISHYAMPHPSGRNHQLNDEEYVRYKVDGLVDYIERQMDIIDV